MHAHSVVCILIYSLRRFLVSCLILCLYFWFRNLFCKLNRFFTSCWLFRLRCFGLFRNWLDCLPDLLCIVYLLLFLFLGSLPLFTANVCSKSSHLLHLNLFLNLLEVLQTIRFKFRCHLALILPSITLCLLILVTMIGVIILCFALLFLQIVVLFDVSSCGFYLCWWLLIAHST